MTANGLDERRAAANGPDASGERPAALVGLAIALLVGATEFGRWLVPGKDIASLVAREGIWWASAAALLLWLVKAERLPLSSIGLRWTGWRGIVIGLAAGVALVAIQIVHFTLLAPALGLDVGQALGQRSSVMQMPLWFRLAMVLRAAVVEEIIFRGYIIEKGAQLTGRLAAGVLLSIVVFTYAHLSGWGAVHLIPVAASAVLLSLLYAWRRDLPSNMLAHFLVDAIGFLG